MAERLRPAPLYNRLPRGPHRLGRRAVAQHQRLRIHGAMARAVASDGYEALSVRQVIALAGVSRRSFYEQFSGKQECFLATFDAIAGRQLASARLASAQASGAPERRLQATLAACADAVAADREAAALVLIEVLGAGTPGALRLRAAAAAWERLLASVLKGPPLSPAPAGATAAGVLGGMHGILTARIRSPSPLDRSLIAEELAWWAAAPRVPSRRADARRLAARLRDSVRRARDPALAVSDCEERGDRVRILSAALRLTAREAVGGISALEIADEARVPPEAFFELFADRDACLRAALADAGEPLLAIAAAAAAEDDRWPYALRASLTGILAHLAAHPLQARAVTMLGPCAGGACRRYGERLESGLAALLGAAYPDRGALAGEALVGAIWHLVRCHLAGRRIRRLGCAADHLALLALAPAVGAEEAAAVLAAEPRARER
jgi:AcrR family transcriptional regulator